MLQAGDPGPAIWGRIPTLTMLGLFVAAAILSWRGVGASRFGIAISVVARSVLA
ncbi:MAG: hypothetical protein M3N46_04975 [Actinomycetota bacterium]|nr:hypothetical protein [Actinomycetota bacterium]